MWGSLLCKNMKIIEWKSQVIDSIAMLRTIFIYRPNAYRVEVLFQLYTSLIKKLWLETCDFFTKHSVGTSLQSRGRLVPGDSSIKNWEFCLAWVFAVLRTLYEWLLAVRPPSLPSLIMPQFIYLIVYVFSSSFAHIIIKTSVPFCNLGYVFVHSYKFNWAGK